MGCWLNSCQPKQLSPQAFAQKVVQNYQQFKPDQMAALFTDRATAMMVSDLINHYPNYINKKRAESDQLYQQRIAHWVAQKQQSFKINWKMVKFDKVVVDASKRYGKSLQTIDLRIVFRGKVSFQQAVKLIKLKGKLYLWQLGGFDRYRQGKKA
ncbi:hypothetical protein M23134_05352 [Microscilla marina ATCC 23134]|uniref:Uncharacterized protein n=1 Tax=Microscilla marina ATCC 23134 TaxID=313606 RepID=A1ZHL2_MICM2|nr:hypothetical protein M23134_05352 [Microscilla marina ATCC 23134]